MLPQGGQQETCAGRVEQPSLSERFDLIPARARAENVPHFVMRSAKPLCRLDTLEALHQLDPLLDASMVLLDSLNANDKTVSAPHEDG